ncbi:uncharacterized protein LOC116579408 isoform X2 [Mustela erminea]|uniref:uncharacterized protein LOC116579408 isoform X2 n=1 Tax=Mustela erminea TaxID=36723 RepID=UPI0013868BB8|nr:uncharacterized protein LOC116579408 isoform X2 [Mustela erminea]XP_032180704.1 uncharacterized protein LOC116579408 isoform X2 [Mustela erminea]XP_032180705.1 uncharacterized protein LOC116579408 isoform X2 [Mustela erminea]
MPQVVAQSLPGERGLLAPQRPLLPQEVGHVFFHGFFRYEEEMEAHSHAVPSLPAVSFKDVAVTFTQEEWGQRSGQEETIPHRDSGDLQPPGLSGLEEYI